MEMQPIKYFVSQGNFLTQLRHHDRGNV